MSLKLSNKQLKQLAIELRARKFSDEFKNLNEYYNLFEDGELYPTEIAYSGGKSGGTGKIVLVYYANDYDKVYKYYYTDTRDNWIFAEV